jgi:hypothetical protein
MRGGGDGWTEGQSEMFLDFWALLEAQPLAVSLLSDTQAKRQQNMPKTLAKTALNLTAG